MLAVYTLPQLHIYMPLAHTSVSPIFQDPGQSDRPFTTTLLTLDSNPDEVLLHQINDQAYPPFQSIPLACSFEPGHP